MAPLPSLLLPQTGDSLLGCKAGPKGCPQVPAFPQTGSQPRPFPCLTVSQVAHEAALPHELLGTDATLVGIEACVSLPVLYQVMLPLELLLTHGAV